jgi:excinuclease ABC subunit A
VEKIRIFGARVHNLKNINLDIPREKLVVFTGLSGSGKSSLAFDTIYAEGQRRYVESLSSYARQFLASMDKPDVDHIEGLSPAVSIDQKTAQRSPRSTVGTMSEIYDYLRLLFTRIGRVYCPKCKKIIHKREVQIVSSEPLKKRGRILKVKKPETVERYYCPTCDITLPEISIKSFSFNSPEGACPICQGLGMRWIIDPALVLPNPRLTLAEGAIRPWIRMTAQASWHNKVLEKMAQKYRFSPNVPVGKLSKRAKDLVLYGDFNEEREGIFEGVIPNLERRYKETTSDYLRSEIEKYMKEIVCLECQGQRLRKEILQIFLAEKNITQISSMSVEKVYDFFQKLTLSEGEQKIASSILKEIKSRLKFLIEVGLPYLSLNRSAQTLAGGEAQRIRLATQLGSFLEGVIYVLDEPSIGLHFRDQAKLIAALKKLRDLSNSVLVVEHDKQTMLAADWIVDIGPGAGRAGGEIVAQGTPSQIISNAQSLTGQYLAGKKTVPMPPKRRQAEKFLQILGAQEFNLKNIDVRIPLKSFVCVTGVSGSGKSTLVFEILAKALLRRFHHAKTTPGKHQNITGWQYIDKVIDINQSPIGRTPRSNPATFTGVFTPIRELYASLPAAQRAHFGPNRFSFNLKGGRCEVCRGDGAIKMEMYFLPDVYVKCEACQGKRYRPEILEIYYKGKNIADILDMTVDEALEFFKSEEEISKKLQVLKDVGLDYVPLGQPATTLSGGEAQRIKLAAELSRAETGNTLYILDEPTTGLHFEDIKHLLIVLQRLVDRGNTVLVVEHNLDVIKCADWIVDLGPEGGEKGGEVVFEGKPEDIITNKNSYTGKYLKEVLDGKKKTSQES